MITCPHCNSTIEQTCRFCPNCGASLITIVPPTPPEASPQDLGVTAGLAAPVPVAPPPLLLAPALLRPALIGGVVMGGLSSLPFLNFCCCLWMLGGGVLASYLYLAQAPPGFAATSTDGARVGLVAGFFGFVTQSVLFGLFQAVMSMAGRAPFSTRFRDQLQQVLARQGDMPPESRQFLDWLSTPAGAAFLVVLTITTFFVAFILLGTLGGMVGANWFSKKAKPSAT